MGSFMARTAPPVAKTTETSPASLLDDATMHLRLILVVTALLGILVERLHTSVDGKLLKPAKKLFFLAGVLALGLRATGVALEGDVALLGAAALLAVAVAVEASCARRDDRALDALASRLVRGDARMFDAFAAAATSTRRINRTVAGATKATWRDAAEYAAVREEFLSRHDLPATFEFHAYLAKALRASAASLLAPRAESLLAVALAMRWFGDAGFPSFLLVVGLVLRALVVNTTRDVLFRATTPVDGPPGTLGAALEAARARAAGGRPASKSVRAVLGDDQPRLVGGLVNAYVLLACAYAATTVTVAAAGALALAASLVAESAFLSATADADAALVDGELEALLAKEHAARSLAASVRRAVADRGVASLSQLEGAWDSFAGDGDGALSPGDAARFFLWLHGHRVPRARLAALLDRVATFDDLAALLEPDVPLPRLAVAAERSVAWWLESPRDAVGRVAEGTTCIPTFLAAISPAKAPRSEAPGPSPAKSDESAESTALPTRAEPDAE